MCFGGNIILFKNGLEHSRWGMVCFALYPAPLFTFLFYDPETNQSALFTHAHMGLTWH